MTYEQVKLLVESLGLPYYYLAGPPGTACPFICWYFDADDDLAADNTNYAKIRTLFIELYTDYKDFDLEARIEATLNAAEIVYSRSENYIDTERMLQVVFSAQIIIKEA